MRLKKVLAVGAVAVVLVAAGGLASSQSRSRTCANVVLDETVGPDGKHRLVTFQRDCGGTTGFSTHVSLLSRSAELPPDGGNVFIADTDHGGAPSGSGGGPEVRVRWISPRHAAIEHHRAIRIFKSEDSLAGVQLEFAAFR